MMDLPRNEQLEKCPLIFSKRLVLVIMAFLGLNYVYTVRVNLSVAILCMVRQDVISFNVTNGNGTDVTTNASSDRGACSGDIDSVSGKSSNDQAEFDWDKSTRSTLLAMYFYGYIFTQFPGGWLASMYGGRRVWGAGMFLSALCTLLTPVSARTHVYLAYTVRFVLGFSAGMSFPCVHALLGRWAPPYERSRLTSVIFAGVSVGTIATFAISGVLCEYGFDNGWGSTFYLPGVLLMVWVLAWFLLIADSPAQHKGISTRERLYIETAIGKGSVKVQKIPWLKMATSGPLWAIVVAHVCNNYANYTLLTSLPMFMKESLNFDIKQNGVLSAVPYLCQFVGSLLVGHVADTLRERRILSTRMVRKSFQCISFVGMAVCLISVVQMTCEQRYIALVFLCLCTVFMGFNRAGYVVNHLDLAPSYAGVLYGITNTVATIPGMVAPIVAGTLTPNKSASEWANVFYVCAAIALFGGVVYAILADGELQAWAISPDHVIVRDITILQDIKQDATSQNRKDPVEKDTHSQEQLLK